MIDPRISALLAKAHQLTMSSRLSWKEADRDDSFIASFSTYSIKISARGSRTDEFSTEYVISILDQWGDVIEEIGDEEFSDSGKTFGLMKELYERARGIAKGVDEALNSIIRDLDDL